MPHATWRTVSVFVASTVLAAVGLAQEVRVADPEFARAAGLTGSVPVYVLTKQADETQLEPKAWGTVAKTSTTVAGNQFRPRISTGAYSTDFGAGDITFVSGDTFFDARVDLPSGAIWKEVSFWGGDSDAGQDENFFLFSSCNSPSAPGTPVNTSLGTGATTGAPGNFLVTVSAADTVIDNNACIYWARARFNAVGLRLDKARIVWQRQVTPAPATATFNDVPTGHPFFRFVEALASAGITGGCGSGNFCPDNAVTRGQMAVFLSVALGLHFPN